MKKKIEKKAVQEKPKPKEIKFKFESGRMIFELGDRQFFLKEEQANFLFGRNIGIKFEQLRADEIEDFSDLNIPDFVAKFKAANEFYGNLQDAGKYLKVDEQRLKRWMADNYSQRQSNKIVLYDDKFVYQESYEKYRKQLFGEEKEEETKLFNPSMKMIDKIANIVMKKTGPREIAKKLKLDYSPFINWFTKGEPQRRIQNVIINAISRRESLKRHKEQET